MKLANASLTQSFFFDGETKELWCWRYKQYNSCGIGGDGGENNRILGVVVMMKQKNSGSAGGGGGGGSGGDDGGGGGGGEINRVEVVVKTIEL